MKGVLAVLLIVSGASGCDWVERSRDSPIEYDSAEVYYRDMNSLAPVDFTEDMLRKSPVVRLSVKESADVRALYDRLPQTCVARSGNSAPGLDYYLVIDFSAENGGSAKFSSSQLEYVFDGRPYKGYCSFDEAERDDLSLWIEARG